MTCHIIIGCVKRECYWVWS